MSAPISAHAALAEKQGKQASDRRVSALVDDLRPSLPPALAVLLDGDSLAVGEVGEVHPDVATWTLGKNEAHLITFSTGMFAYLDAVARPLSALFVGGASGSTSLTIDRVAELLRRVMTTYRKQTSLVWSIFKPQFDVDAIHVAPEFAAVFADLTALTARFLLAHEFGHVALQTGVCPRSAALEEIDADRLGLEFSLRAALESRNQQLGVAAAGLSIRMLVSLQRFGVTFTDDYPPMTDRLRVLGDALEALVGSAQRRDELSRVMVAMLDAMDDLDDRIEPHLKPLPITTDRVRVGLIARLYEVARGNVAVDAFVRDIGAVSRTVPGETFAPAVGSLCDYYWDWADTEGVYIRDLEQRSTYTHPWLIANSRALRAAIAVLPPELLAAVPERCRPPSAEPKGV